ncbi:MAG: glycosyl hydrolase [Rikenellaceae bacterium]
MIKKNLLALLCVALLFTFTTSCDDSSSEVDNEPDTTEPDTSTPDVEDDEEEEEDVDPFSLLIPVSLSDETVEVDGYKNSYIKVDGSTSLTITGTGVSALDNSYINILSSDSRVFFPNITRSYWELTTIAENIYIKGERFVNGVNGNIKPYYDNLYIEVIDPNFSPAIIYSGEESVGIDISTIYLGSEIPLGDNTVDKILLKRGHQIVVAASEDGTVSSRCFIALKNDLEIILDETLSKQVSFMRALAVPYTNKSGIGGKSYGTYHEGLYLPLYYNWGVTDGLFDQDTEFIPMYWAKSWVSDSNNQYIIDMQYPLLMAFNEPDNSDQANLDYETAVEYYKEMHKLGVRLGSPSTEQVGSSATAWATGTTQWIHLFMAEVEKQGLRVDVMGFHWYDVGYIANLTATTAASSSPGRLMTNAEACFERYGRPIIITEFNCGTAGTYSTSTSSNRWDLAQGFFQNVVPMLEASEAIERYAMFPPHSTIYGTGTDSSGNSFKKGLVDLVNGSYVLNENGESYKCMQSTPSIVYADDSTK